MNKIILSLTLLTSILFVSACGRETDFETIDTVPGKTGLSGNPGSDGQSGTNGTNGHNSLITLLNSAPSCLNGGIVVVVGLDLNDDGLLSASEAQQSQAVCNGNNGSNGTNGVDGHNALVKLVASVNGGGASCTTGGVSVLSGTDLNNNGQLDLSEVSFSKDVCNGNNGLNGTNGTNGNNAPPTPFTPIALLDPCGDTPGIFDEIFIKLQNGTIIASFSDKANGENTRFSVLVAGNFVTTDGSNCHFSVDASGNLSW